MAIDIAPMWAISVYFDRYATPGKQIGEVKEAPAVFKIFYFEFRMKVVQMSEYRPPDILDEELFGVVDLLFQSSPALRAALLAMSGDPVSIGIR